MKDRRWIVLCCFGLVVAVLMNLPEGAESRVKGAVRDGVVPIQTGVSASLRRAANLWSYLRGVGDLAMRNAELSGEITRLRSELRLAQDIERENEQLRDLLKFCPRPATSLLVPCEVVGRDSTGWWSTVRLDKGRLDGVRPDRAVITPDGLAGRTVAVSEHSADVVLLSDPSCQVSVRFPRSNARGLAVGSRTPGIRCRVLHVPVDADVAPGDEIVTSGDGGVFPKGLLVGRVSRVGRDPNGLSLVADVETAADLAAMEYAFVSAIEEDRDEEEEYSGDPAALYGDER